MKSQGESFFTSREAARSCRGVFSLVGKKTIGLLKNDKFPFDDSSCWEGQLVSLTIRSSLLKIRLVGKRTIGNKKGTFFDKC